MDELTIDDKKYISSKRAAQITGYAKDYIGQLCREGYVEAKRVGRSWYVLEAGIKDHRFGNDGHKETLEAEAPIFTLTRSEEKPLPIAPVYSPVATPAPHYEVIEPPSINLLRKDEDVTPMKLQSPPQYAQGDRPAQDFHEAWQTWFDTFHAPQSTVSSASPVATHEEGLSDSGYKPAPLQMETAIPIHHLEEPLKIEHAPMLAPQRPILEVRVEDAMHHRPIISPTRGIRSGVARVLGGAVSVVVICGAVGLAAVGTGYFDDSLISVTRANVVSGIFVVNK